MCGIAGRIGPNAATAGLKMQRALHHRGPDDAGAWQSPGDDIFLAHTRLAIIDLSPAGHQPMISADGRYVLVFNGEIYNYADLRAELTTQGHCFQSNSDTEVILQGCSRYGANFIPRLRGMFAFCLWDTQTQTALLARDPFGIKPLYLSTQNGQLTFASELRALLASDCILRELDPNGVAGFFATGSVPEPSTIIKDVTSLPPGHFLTWINGHATTTRYWELTFAEPPTIAAAQAIPHTRQALESSVRAHLVSDVPVGLFLSGGIDSTALLALTRQAQPDGIIKTFSISVDHPGLDEASAAANTAAHFHTEHHEFKINADIAAAAFPDYLAAMDSPSVDGFNTWMVSRCARSQGMKVVLSGLGGDELMAGYNTFLQVPKLRMLGRILGLTGPIRKFIGKLISRFGKSSRHQRLGEFLQGPPTLERAYAATRGVFSASAATDLAHHFCGRSPTPPPPSPNSQANIRDAVSALELTRYMRNQLLRDSDVMSMAHGLELRVPLVDAQLFDQLALIPAEQRLQQGKQLFLQAVPEVPASIANAPKRGFSFPFAQWLATDFGTQFSLASQNLPVRSSEWYQQWALFVFREWCQRAGFKLP